MKKLFTPLLAAGAVGMLIMSVLIPGATNFAAATPDANACSQFVQKAPILDDETTDAGAPIVAVDRPDGQVTPIVLVHGWTGYGDHNKDRKSQFSLKIDREANGHGGMLLDRREVHASLTGKLQQIPGAAVYTFDYHPVSTHWVTNPKISPKLAKGIECLTNQFGNKAVVIGHSMGGLALRGALGLNDSQGAPISERVSKAMTFGTPNEGTEILGFAMKAIDATQKIPGINIPVGIMKLVMRECSKKADATGEYCFGAGGPVDALYSEGALAMIPGSQELAQLPPWPDNVNYTAFAGDIQLGGFTLFGFSSKRAIDLGDTAVDHASAISQAKDSKTINCEYGIVSRASAKEVGLRIASIFKGRDAARPTGLLTPARKGYNMASPCFHNNLMAETNLSTAALNIVETYVDTPTPIESKSVTEVEATPKVTEANVVPATVEDSAPHVSDTVSESTSATKNDVTSHKEPTAVPNQTATLVATP
ncbi:MAG: alpha/beta hydrolase [Actinomycetaceae bacterium]|nr:alpha/beta hydrolase [Actinomycetaceae bacterium]